GDGIDRIRRQRSRGEARALPAFAAGTHMRHGSASGAARGSANVRPAPATPEQGSSAAGWLRITLVVCGLAVFVFLLVDTGLAAIAHSFRELSWRLLVVLVFPCTLIKLFDTLAWQCTFVGTRVPLWTLVQVRLAGQAINTTTPTGTLGGDAV